MFYEIVYLIILFHTLQLLDQRLELWVVAFKKDGSDHKNQLKSFPCFSKCLKQEYYSILDSFVQGVKMFSSFRINIFPQRVIVATLCFNVNHNFVTYDWKGLLLSRNLTTVWTDFFKICGRNGSPSNLVRSITFDRPPFDQDRQIQLLSATLFYFYIAFK